MHTRNLYTGIAVILTCAALACGDSNAPESENFVATLRGSNERPNPVATAATGSAQITLTGRTVSYAVNFTGLSGNPLAAHIHGPADDNTAAGVVVPLENLPASTEGTIAGSFTATTDPQVSFDSLLVLMRKSLAYVNIHTETYPAGEIRGQISRR